MFCVVCVLCVLCVGVLFVSVLCCVCCVRACCVLFVVCYVFCVVCFVYVVCCVWACVLCVHAYHMHSLACVNDTFKVFWSHVIKKYGGIVTKQHICRFPPSPVFVGVLELRL